MQPDAARRAPPLGRREVTNEFVLERLGYCQALRRVQDENLLEQICKVLQLLDVVAVGLVLQDVFVDVFIWLIEAHLLDDLLLRAHIFRQVLEDHIGLLLLEMLVEKRALLEQLLRWHPLVVHELLEHLVVVAPGEHELAGVELEETHAHRPQIHRKRT